MFPPAQELQIFALPQNSTGKASLTLSSAPSSGSITPPACLMKQALECINFMQSFCLLETYSSEPCAYGSHSVFMVLYKPVSTKEKRPNFNESGCFGERRWEVEPCRKKFDAGISVQAITSRRAAMSTLAMAGFLSSCRSWHSVAPSDGRDFRPSNWSVLSINFWRNHCYRPWVRCSPSRLPALLIKARLALSGF